MTLGLAAASANTGLDAMFATGDLVYLHTADPGAAGTTSRLNTAGSKTVTWASASSGSKAATSTLPSWTSWADTNGAVVTHVSIFSSGGTFKGSGALGTSRTVNTGDTFSLTSLSTACSTIAA